jgi:CSLREA domain-containing protein
MRALRRPANLLTGQSSRRFDSQRLQRLLQALAIIAGVVTLPLAFPPDETSANKGRSKQIRGVLAKLSDGISVQSSGKGSPRLSFGYGRDVITSFDGETDAAEALRQEKARPLSLASADFDADGVPDLVSGYAISAGGLITLHRGNQDSIYPNSLEAQQRRASGQFTDSPFLSPARAFAAPEAAEIVVAGDFNADGHRDIVSGRSGSDRIYLLPGDGQGNFDSPETIELPASLTAMIGGEINRPDGMIDLIVAVSGPGGSGILIYEALSSPPEIIDLSQAATSLALGQLVGGDDRDLAVATGRELLIVHGRDRNLTGGPPSATSRAFPFTIEAIAVGDFTGDKEADVALLSDDGMLYLIGEKIGENVKSDGQNSRQLSGEAKAIDRWGFEPLAERMWPQADRLACARMTGSGADSLIVLDPGGCQLHIVERGSANRPAQPGGESHMGEPVSFHADGAPMAALPMRLNGDALSDLVILKSAASPLSVLITQPQTVFTVNSEFDGADTNVGNGICDADSIEPGAQCTLRAAIQEANANPGADSIHFSISSGPQTINIGATSGPTMGTPLPTITGPVTIDATTQPGFINVPIIELNGTGAGVNANGLNITAGSTTVRGLVINRFGGGGSNGNGIFMQTNGGNIIEGNYIGTSANGTTDLGNANNGVSIGGVSGNMIGGTTGSARNVISGNNGAGLTLIFTTATNNIVQGNYIGTNATGTAALGNSLNGVSSFCPANTIGGTTAGARNVISGNGQSGVLIGGSTSVTGNLVQGNFIGTNVNGDLGRGNNSFGVDIDGSDGAPATTIGGPSPTARNVISGNKGSGIRINGSGAIGALVQNNLIGTDATESFGIGNAGAGVRITGGTNSVLSSNAIAFNGNKGVTIASGSANKIIINNRIHSNTGLGIDLGDNGVTFNDLGDGDTGANALQNFPGLGPVNSDQSTSIRGTLNSTPNRNYRIEFYRSAACDPFGNGEGQIYLGSITVTTDNSGDATFLATGLPAIPAGQAVSATATREDTKNTSEFSFCAFPVCINSCDASAPPIAAAGASVAFTSTVSATCPVSYNWDFGDGTTNSSEKNPSHTYAAAGVYNWTLRLNQSGCIQTGTISITNVAPTIDAFFPAGGFAGTSVTIMGTNFTGATMVKFNSLSAAFVLDSPSQITAVVPDGAVTGPITVLTAGGTAISVATFKIGIATITVNSAADTDARDSFLTLREAIRVANGQISRFALSSAEAAQVSGNPTGPSLDRILFSIGSGARTISLSSAFDTITGPVIIDATTQPGYGGTPIITLNGAGAGTGANGLKITAGCSTVRGLVINRFNGNGVSLEANGRNLVAGNYIGTNLNGNTDLGNVGHGLNIIGDDNVVGGTAAAARNLLSGNGQRGVSINGSRNRVMGNYIGTHANGTTAMGNDSFGVTFAGSDNAIGARLNLDGSVFGLGNTIAYNSVGVQGFDITGPEASLRNSILYNSIHSNILAQIRLNVPCPPPSACSIPGPLPNNGQIPPTLTSVSYNNVNGTLNITGEMVGVPGALFYITFYNYAQCPNSVPGGDPQFINTLPLLVVIGPDGSVPINPPPFMIPPPTGFINAQATDALNNSSSLSPCVPIGGSCLYSITPASDNLLPEGDTRSVAVTTTAGCPWSATSNAPWISILSGESGSGMGEVTYSAQANPGASPRTGTMTVAGQTLTVNQNANSCAYSLGSASQAFSSGSGFGSVNVMAGASCAWGVVSDLPEYIIITSSTNVGTGMVNYTVASNAGPARSHTMTIAGQPFTVNQNSGCLYSIDKTSQSFPASLSPGTIQVTAGADCAWTAVSNDSFITITSGGNASGLGEVTYSVSANPDPVRRIGTITVAGQIFTVLQGAAFLDVPVGYLFYSDIGKLSARGITVGCGSGNYCPEAPTTREQMAAFIIRSIGIPNPPPPSAQRFGDVPPSNPFYAFIEEMAVRQITSGCGGGNYCPGLAVTREQMAAFIIRALGEFAPAAPPSQRFFDVPPNNQFYAFIDRMAALGITQGCGGGNYCPLATVTRGQMAAFLVRAFNL